MTPSYAPSIFSVEAKAGSLFVSFNYTHPLLLATASKGMWLLAGNFLATYVISDVSYLVSFAILWGMVMICRSWEAIATKNFSPALIKDTFRDVAATIIIIIAGSMAQLTRFDGVDPHLFGWVLNSAKTIIIGYQLHQILEAVINASGGRMKSLFTGLRDTLKAFNTSHSNPDSNNNENSNN